MFSKQQLYNTVAIVWVQSIEQNIVEVLSVRGNKLRVDWYTRIVQGYWACVNKKPQSGETENFYGEISKLKF